MSRRTHACLTCRGRTRHDDQICATCRRAGHTNRDGQVRLVLLANVPDHHAPRREDLDHGIDLTPMLAWHGTDCPCARCVRDRIPGRYA